MSRDSVRFLVVLLIALLTVHRATAVTIIGDGDDLLSAISAAPDGEVIEIQSSAIFVGTIAWFGKSLTIQAAPGFSPIIMGSPKVGHRAAQPALIQSEGVLRGLCFQPGIGSDGVIPAVSLGSSSTSSNITLVGNTVDGVLRIAGTGDRNLDATLLGNTLVGGLTISGTGNFNLQATLMGNLIQGSSGFSGTGFAQIDAIVEDNTFEMHVSIGGTGSLRINATFLKNSFESPVSIGSIYRSSLDLIFNENYFGSTVSLRSGDSIVSARFSNNSLDSAIDWQREPFYRGVVSFDNNTVRSRVPEPASFALAIAAASICTARRTCACSR